MSNNVYNTLHYSNYNVFLIPLRRPRSASRCSWGVRASLWAQGIPTLPVLIMIIVLLLTMLVLLLRLLITNICVAVQALRRAAADGSVAAARGAAALGRLVSLFAYSIYQFSVCIAGTVFMSKRCVYSLLCFVSFTCANKHMYQCSSVPHVLLFQRSAGPRDNIMH